MEECGKVLNLLLKYEASFGQKINKEKMAFFFSRSTQECTQDVIKRMLGVQEIKHYKKYLGLPSLVRRSNKASFSYIKKGCGRSYKVGKGNFCLKQEETS